MNKSLSILILILLASCNQKDLNLLIIHTDQQSQWTIGAYGLDDFRGPLTTPNLDKLAEEGILCTNFFTNSAVCSPSRALMMTGLYATENGVYSNNMVLNDVPTIASILNENGYATGYSGKWHLSGTPRPGWEPESYGWNDNKYMFNRGHYKKITEGQDGNPQEHPYKEIGNEKSYTTDFLTDKTIDFIRDHKNEKFAYMVSYPDPHQPWQVREPYNSMYNETDMHIPETFIHHDNPINDWHDSLIQKHYNNLNPDRLQKIKATYSGSVHLIDFNVGRLIDELKDLELFDKTLLIYTSDHGEYMGEHGMLYKNQLFETAHRLPLIIHLPGRNKTKRNTSVFSMVDFTPGVLGLMGIDDDDYNFHGRDFSNVLDNEDEWLNEAYVHHSGHIGVGLFTRDHYLILHRSGEHLLFDRINDPEEMNNLYYDEDYQNIVNDMTMRIVNHHKQYITPEYKWIKEMGE